MATTYTRQKDGKMKVTKRTGFDAASHAFGSTLEKIKSVGKKVVKKVGEPSRRYNKAQAAKEIDDVSRAFGSVDEYVKINPSYAKRAEELKKRAYDN